MLDRVSLRTRLVVGVVALAAIALIAADLVTYHSLRSFLLDRTDSSLQATSRQVDAALHGRPPGPGPGGFPGDGLDAVRLAGRLEALSRSDPDLYVELREPSGTAIFTHQVTPFGTSPLPGPKLPSTIDVAATPGGAQPIPTYLTVKALSGSDRYRVLATADPQGRVLLLATTLNGPDGTLHRLFLIELLGTIAVLAAMTVLALWLVRVGLKPLDDISETASEIAAGDLSRRVEVAGGEHTEVGRLGLALNAMLGHIEAAFTAQAASEQKLRTFVADASHELRTPLAAVRAYAELYERGASTRPDDLARALSGITRESERMSVLVDDLLLLARLDEGRPLEHEPVALDQVVDEAVETARTVDPERPIELTAVPALVLGDRDRLRQVIDNILANVRAHTPEKTPVAVRLTTVDGSAVLEIEDSGPGLSEEDLGQVFERFYRADTSRARESGGVGLGLSIVSAVAEAHGGTATVRSELGHGATFVVTLSLAE